MNTVQVLETLADAMENFSADHKARLHRLEQRRQWLATRETGLLRAFDHAGQALQECRKAMLELVDELQKLDAAELYEAGETPPDDEPDELPPKGNGLLAAPRKQ